MWTDEEEFYDYETNTCQEGKVRGHYSKFLIHLVGFVADLVVAQVVWKHFYKIGATKVVCDDNKGTFAVANYNPPGNFHHEKPC